MNINRKAILLIVSAMALLVMALPALAAEEATGYLVSPTVMVMRSDDGDVAIWSVDEDGLQAPILDLSAAELAEVETPEASNLMVAEAGIVAVYKLTSGEWQVNVAPDSEGKVHAMIFDADFVFDRHADFNIYPDDGGADE